MALSIASAVASSYSAATLDGIRLSDLAEELPLGRSSVFELLKGLRINTAKGPGANGKGRVAWVSSADADRLREAARAVHAGERKIADFSAALVSLESPQTPAKGAPTPSVDSTDSAPFLARLEAAERAVSSGLGLTTAETAWILGVHPGSSPVTRGGITAERTGRNCWRLSRAALAAVLLAFLGACSVPEPEAVKPKEESFKPGVEGRSAEEVCQSTSPKCQEWTALARKCEENMRALDAGDMSPKQPYCTEMETLREQITGIADSSSPGAYNF